MLTINGKYSKYPLLDSIADIDKSDNGISQNFKESFDRIFDRAPQYNLCK
jgi:hypothetical protein